MEKSSADLIQIGALRRKTCHGESAVSRDERGDALPDKRFKIRSGIPLRRKPVVVRVRVKKAGGDALPPEINHRGAVRYDLRRNLDNPVVFD
ncbi:hypothetical protein SDC9_117084 [bioreactor metagenome]|uniref:Uncharacterized protein n=1 Tax=bioreactor metagenome TaxID=1076179 RepID=A0A645BZM1_9ZZZZ